MSFNNEDLQTFLIQAELVHEKVKALAQNRMSTEEFDKLEKLRAEDKRKRQQAQKRRERQAFEKKKQGRQGKGITKDFQNFCKFCYRQYQLPTPLCLRCNRNTMTLKERQEQLEVMVGQYKYKKKRREERKMKWQMWQKTKAMLWRKTSNNYDKWDYFVSDSEEQTEKQPIVPKDDPNFKALQRDMEQRKALRMKDTKKAKQLKQKGNAFMKQGKYEQAKNMYTLALEHIKDIKSIYTNRALAFIKLGKFKKAVKDCTDVIEYMELFEKVEENRDLVFKAYLRRASAKKQMKDYKEALDDAKKALTFYPTDKSAQILRKQIEGFIEYSEKVQKLLRESNKNPQSEKKKVEEQNQKFQQQEKKAEEMANQGQQQVEQSQPIFKQSDIVKQLAEASLEQQRKKENTKQVQKAEQLQSKTESKQETKNQPNIPNFTNQIQEIRYRLQNLTEQNINALFFLLRQKKQLVNIFISAKGIQKCLSQMLSAEECLKQGYLISMCLRGDAVGEKEVWDFGIQKIYKRVSEILFNNNELHFGKYLMLEDIFEILIPLSLHEKYRIMLNQSNQTYQFLEKTFSQLITRYKKQPDLFSSVLIYMGNLCSGDSKLRDLYINDQKFNIIVNSLYEKVILRKTFNRNHLNLKKNAYNLLANLAININHRTKLVKSFNQKQLSSENQGSKWGQIVKELKFYQRSNQNFTQYIMSLLSLFTNVTLGTSSNIQGLAQCINERFLSNPALFDLQIINRALLTASRVKYDNKFLFKQMIKNFSLHLETFKKKKNDRSLMQHVVRILNIVYSPIEGQNKFEHPMQDNLVKQLKQYISSLQYGEILFCNTCNLFSVILDTKTSYGGKFYNQLLSNIKFLIDVAKDKVGNWRKNSATLLAKLSINAECKKQLQKHHGMEVLKSIAQFVK